MGNGNIPSRSTEGRENRRNRGENKREKREERAERRDGRGEEKADPPEPLEGRGDRLRMERRVNTPSEQSSGELLDRPGDTMFQITDGFDPSEPREKIIPRNDITTLIESLHELFEEDRLTASLPDAVRCGICYRYFRKEQLVYHTLEGYYACSSCERSTANYRIKMLRRQQQ